MLVGPGLCVVTIAYREFILLRLKESAAVWQRPGELCMAGCKRLLLEVYESRDVVLRFSMSDLRARRLETMRVVTRTVVAAPLQSFWSQIKKNLRTGAAFEALKALLEVWLSLVAMFSSRPSLVSRLSPCNPIASQEFAFFRSFNMDDPLLWNFGGSSFR